MFRFTIFLALSTLYYIIREEQQTSDLVVFHTLASYGELDLSNHMVSGRFADSNFGCSQGQKIAEYQRVSPCCDSRWSKSCLRFFFEYGKENLPFGLKN